MKIDIMLDIETLGKQDNTAIFNIYAKAINRETFEDITDFEGFIDINTIDPSLIEMDTLYWWTQNHPELFKELTTVTDKHQNEYHVATDLYFWIDELLHKGKGTFEYGTNEVYLWGNGSVFDNIKVKNLLKRNGYPYPIFYRNDRDLRTLLETASIASGLTEDEIKKQCEVEGAVAHNAKDDVEYQINILKRSFELIKGE